jgi:hypothetical protein
MLKAYTALQEDKAAMELTLHTKLKRLETVHEQEKAVLRARASTVSRGCRRRPSMRAARRRRVRCSGTRRSSRRRKPRIASRGAARTAQPSMRHPGGRRSSGRRVPPALHHMSPLPRLRTTPRMLRRQQQQRQQQQRSCCRGGAARCRALTRETQDVRSEVSGDCSEVSGDSGRQEEERWRAFGERSNER